MIPSSSTTTRPRPQCARRLAALVLPAVLLATGLTAAVPAPVHAAAQSTRQPADTYPVRAVKPENCPKGTPETVEVPGNFGEADLAITCVDGRHSRNIADHDRFTRELRRAAPFFGSQVGAGYMSLACAFCPAPAKRVTQPLQRGDERPTLVVNSTLDQVTPIEGARALASELRSPLVTLQGAGHGLYGFSSNACTTHTADAYLIRGELPAGNITCKSPQPSSALPPPGSWWFCGAGAAGRTGLLVAPQHGWTGHPGGQRASGDTLDI